MTSKNKNVAMTVTEALEIITRIGGYPVHLVPSYGLGRYGEKIIVCNVDDLFHRFHIAYESSPTGEVRIDLAK